MRSWGSWVACCMALVLGVLGQGQVAGQQWETLQPAASEHRAVLDRYCVTCHNQRIKTAGLELDALDVAKIGDDAALWEKVVQKLRGRVMPPAGRPRPDGATYKALVSWMETELDRAAAARPNPGLKEAFHRLNRTEYQNAIRDLLALEGFDIALLLPPDDASYGFDNIAGILGVSPTLMDQYLTAARKLSRLAVGDLTFPPNTDTYRIPLDLSQDARLDDLPFGTRGGIAVRRYFPVDGEYQVRFGYAPGFGAARAEPHDLEVIVDGARVQLLTLDETGPQGGYEGRTREGQLSIAVKAGLREVGITFVEKASVQAEDLLQPFLRPPAASSFATSRVGGHSGPYLSWVRIGGPYVVVGVGDTPSRRRIFVCRPASPGDQTPCATQIISTLARRAFRRPVTDTDLDAVLPFYDAGRTEGGFEKGIQIALERILMSPEFLFRVERDPAGIAPQTNYRINDLELASRLSFFLWSSIPDDELLDAATEGRLTEPAELERQVRRMLADARSQALVNNFAGQWLYLRNVPAVAPNPPSFPDFDDSLRRAFRRETELFFESILREERSVLDLVGANYTFVNERLARHYGIPGVYGSHFRRVALDPASPRGGLLGQGSLLTVTSYATRTSPVVRGKWILENVLGSPPPPPPADVPALEEKSAEGQLLSMREAMVQHRENPVCASCHRMMDPLGLALENFDAVGKWRDLSEAGTPIDASGALPDGTPFEGALGLRGALLSHSEEFVMTVTKKLLTYALGRGLEYYDAPAVRTIVREAAADDYALSSLILGAVESVPFQMRRSQS